MEELKNFNILHILSQVATRGCAPSKTRKHIKKEDKESKK